MALLLSCWALWIILAGLLAAQIGIALSRQFAVPAFVLRQIEERFNASHVSARFGRATFDPTGGILLENVSFSLAEFSEPVVHSRALLLELDPWLLLSGQIETRRIHATGLSLSVPAMLTPSGRAEDTVRDLDFSLVPKDNDLQLEYLTAKIAGVTVVAHGTLHLPTTKAAGPVKPLPILEALAQNYAPFCRRLVQVNEKLAALEQPELSITFLPGTKRATDADIRVTARSLSLPGIEKLGGINARELYAEVQVPFLSPSGELLQAQRISGQDTAPWNPQLSLKADDISLGAGPTARALQATVIGSFDFTQTAFHPQTISLTVGEINHQGFSIEALSGMLTAVDHSNWDATWVTQSLGSLLAGSARVNAADRSALLHVQGEFSPDLLNPIGDQLGQNVRRWVDFGEPVAIDLKVAFQPGGKFEKLWGRVAAKKITAYHVAMDAADGEIEFDGRHFLAQRARATLGENEAHGSFEQDLTTLDFRFLLNGRLRPMDIRGWFGNWWPDFFQNLEFPSAPPDASVDVTGRWFSGRDTTVFVFAESKAPTLRGTSLDYARTLMFIRPNFFEGQELFLARGTGDVRGTFARVIDTERGEWHDMSFDLESTVDLATGRSLLGPDLAAKLDPFTFATAPRVKARGQLDGPASSKGEHQSIEIEARSTGDFSLYKFPAKNLSFDATLRDETLTVDHVEAQIAGGMLTGRARLWGPEDKRRLGFDGTLHGSHLSEAIAAVSNYAAQRRGQPPTDPEKFMVGKSEITVDLTMAAEGKLDDLFSYQGTGNAVLNGAELGEVRLLGLLSALLDFTALRFTTARVDFQLQGRKVAFPTVNVTGANSAIEGHGDYWLDRGEMDFNARVYPFQESKSLFQNVVGVVLLPLSTALEVKLTGPLAQPKWAFVIGPTNFLRNLTQPGKPADPAAETAPPPAKEPSPAKAETH